MRHIALAITALSLTACLEQGGSSPAAALQLAPSQPAVPVVPPVVTPPPAWQAPQTAVQAEAELDGLYRLVGNTTYALTFSASAKTASGNIPTSHLVIVGGRAVFFPTTCSFSSSQNYASTSTATTFNYWTGSVNYNLAAGSYSTIQDCQLPSQQGATHTAMQVHFDTEKCITVLFMRDTTTTGRQFCKD